MISRTKVQKKSKYNGKKRNNCSFDKKIARYRLAGTVINVT